jgi:hypothetical protein
MRWGFLFWWDMSDKDRILAEINKLGEKLGRAPSQTELRNECRITWHQVHKHFGGMKAAVRAAGLEPGPKGGPLDERTLVLDWARVVRELGRLPIQAEYDERGKHTAGTLHARIRWRELGHRFVLLVRELHLESEWADVLETVWNQYPWLKHLAASTWEKLRPWGDRVIGSADHRAIENTEDRGCEPLIIGKAGAQPRAAVPHEHSQAMRLGRVVAAALAIEILLALEKSTSAAKAADSMVATAGINACSTPLVETVLQGHADGAECGVSVVDAQIEAGTQAKAPLAERGQRGIGAVYGEPLGLAAMAHAPTNEDGVLFLFGVVAADLGFRIERVQREFPDIEAKREVAPGIWELQLWELEWCSRNFKEHRHDPMRCHGIICWKHNWPDVPEGLEVIELSKVVKGK